MLQISLILGPLHFYEKKVIIWDAEVTMDKENFLAIPGQIINISEKSIHVLGILAMGKSK